MNDSPGSQTKLQELVEKYVQGLAERRLTLEGYFSEISAAVAEEKDLRHLDALASFQFDVHKLTGSAGSMGLDELGQAAGALDVYMSAVQTRGDSFNDVDLAQLSSLYSALDGLLRSQKPENSSLIDRAMTGIESRRPSLVPQIAGTVIAGIGLWCDGMPDLDGKLTAFGWSFERLQQDLLAERLSAGDRNPIGVIMVDHDLAVTVARTVNGTVPVISVGDQGGLDDRIMLIRNGVSMLVDPPVDVFDVIEAVDRLQAPVDHKAVKVVFVDDDPALVALMSYQFLVAGMEATCLDSAENLLGVLSEVQPDVLVLDRNMPRWDGFAVAMVVRQIQAFADMPLIFLTADRRADSRLTALALGGDDYLHKPVDGEHLVSLVRARALRARALRSKIITDGLTGLLNHVAFITEAERQYALARRLKRPVSVTLIDLDHFKSINDTQGHQLGDLVLRGVSSVLLKRLRQSDVVGRLGGEEFAVLMPGTDRQQAARVIDQLREDFSRLEYAGTDGPFTATFSAGVCGEDRAENGSENENFPATVEDLIRGADKALYVAKNQGRNRVSIAEM